MTAGRKPKPTYLKLLAGNPGKRPLNMDEPKPEVSIPDCPENLSDEAKIEWTRITEQLSTLGLITKVDRAALVGYCYHWGIWSQAMTMLKQHGPVILAPSGFPVVNPYLSIANKAMEQMRAFMTEFGMTPSSRSRISVKKPDGSQDDQRFFGK